MRSNMAGGGFYNSEPRNFNRGFGRGIPKPFQSSQRNPPSPQPVRRGGDLFIEAGRLAVDYLVSRGMLSSNVLPGKYQNGNMRNNSGESLDRDSGRRSSSIDRDPSLSRSYSRERRRPGPSRTSSYDWSRENEKEGSLTDEAIPSRGMEVDNDTFHKERTKDTDMSVQNSHPSDPTADDDKHSVLRNEAERGDAESNVTSLVQNKDDKEVVKPSDDVNTMLEENNNITDDNNDEKKDIGMDNADVQQGGEKSDASPLENSNSKIDPLLIAENSVSEPGCDSLDSKRCNSINASEDIPISNSLGTVVSDQSLREAKVLNPAYPVDEQKPIESVSLLEKTFSYEQKSSGLPDLGIFSSIDKHRGEKRPIEEDNMMEGAKKAKQQWLSVARSEEYSRLSDVNDQHSVSPSKRALNMYNVSASQQRFNDVSLPLKDCIESNINQGEKQVLSSSFKICDLNLMGSSDMHENHDLPALLYPTISSPHQNLPVDIDLSMRNGCNFTNEYNDSRSGRKDIEIIDLESETLEGCKSSNPSMKNSEAGITSMESYPNPQNSTDNPDGQDGYGFMISELLGNDVPNCSSVQPDMNTLHNGMGLNPGEGMFSEDDPIYMSLGEIPLTGLLRAWEQPTQERNPFEL